MTASDEQTAAAAKAVQLGMQTAEQYWQAAAANPGVGVEVHLPSWPGPAGPTKGLSYETPGEPAPDARQSVTQAGTRLRLRHCRWCHPPRLASLAYGVAIPPSPRSSPAARCSTCQPRAGRRGAAGCVRHGPHCSVARCLPRPPSNCGRRPRWLVRSVEGRRPGQSSKMIMIGR
jgi:hypothetical protein